MDTTESLWNFVYTEPLPMSGVIDKVSLYTRFASKPLYIVHYRKLTSCQYTAFNVLQVPGVLKVGINEVGHKSVCARNTQ